MKARPVGMLLMMPAGWINRHRRDVIEYLKEKNTVLRETIGIKRIPLDDNQRMRLAHVGKRRDKWYATILVEGKAGLLGLFVEEVDAARAYDRASGRTTARDAGGRKPKAARARASTDEKRATKQAPETGRQESRRHETTSDKGRETSDETQTGRGSQDSDHACQTGDQGTRRGKGEKEASIARSSCSTPNRALRRRGTGGRWDAHDRHLPVLPLAEDSRFSGGAITTRDRHGPGLAGPLGWGLRFIGVPWLPSSAGSTGGLVLRLRILGCGTTQREFLAVNRLQFRTLRTCSIDFDTYLR